MRISTVKLVISFCAYAKFKDIACIVNHHYHVFHVPRLFYSVNKSCSIVFQLHMIPDYISIVFWVTRWHRLGRDFLVSNLARKNKGSLIFTACIVYTAIVCWQFHTLYWKNIWEPHWDRVIMESALYRTAL